MRGKKTQNARGFKHEMRVTCQNAVAHSQTARKDYGGLHPAHETSYSNIPGYKVLAGSQLAGVMIRNRLCKHAAQPSEREIAPNRHRHTRPKGRATGGNTFSRGVFLIGYMLCGYSGTYPSYVSPTTIRCGTRVPGYAIYPILPRKYINS